MTFHHPLQALYATVQVDIGQRGLTRIPGRNLITATADDPANASRSLAELDSLNVEITTGFYIPGATPGRFETDGPLGAFFLARAIRSLGGDVEIRGEAPVLAAISAAETKIGKRISVPGRDFTQRIWIERGGPAQDGRCYTMRGRDITPHLDSRLNEVSGRSIGIGDGGNEIGMGKIPHEIIAANIPNGERIHCQTRTDFLIVAGVSNWGAYALAASLFLLKQQSPPAELFDPDSERAILEVMVQAGPLVDGVTGEPTATVDGLTWDEYARPLIELQRLLR